MQQVFNLLLLYFQLVHFYNAEKKRKSFRGKTPSFFLAFFQDETAFQRRAETEERTNFLENEELFCFGSRH